MKQKTHIPDIVDFAYQIIAMDKEAQFLRSELEHYKELHEINSKTINASMDSTKETLGIIVGAVLDPESAINKGSAALIREEMAEVN